MWGSTSSYLPIFPTFKENKGIPLAFLTKEMNLAKFNFHILIAIRTTFNTFLCPMKKQRQRIRIPMTDILVLPFCH